MFGWVVVDPSDWEARMRRLSLITQNGVRLEAKKDWEVDGFRKQCPICKNHVAACTKKNINSKKKYLPMRNVNNVPFAYVGACTKNMEIYRSNIHMFINGKHRLKSNDFFLVAYGSVRNVFVNPFMVGRPADYGLSNCARLPFLVRMTALPISKTNVFFSLAGLGR